MEDFFLNIAKEHGLVVAFIALFLSFAGKSISNKIKKEIGGNGSTKIIQDNRAEISGTIEGLFNAVSETRAELSKELREMRNEYKSDKEEYRENHLILKKLENKTDSNYEKLNKRVDELEIEIDVLRNKFMK